MYVAEYNLLFIHIPKTAGQSIAGYFLKHLGIDWEDRDQVLMYENRDARKGPPQISHFTVDDYVSSGFLSRDIVDSAIKFCVVRNPWDRLWSEYNFYWRDKISWSDFFDLFPHMTDNHQTGEDHLRHIKPQCEFITPDVEVLRFENLRDDFNGFLERHELPDGFLPHINAGATDRPDYLQMYNRHQMNIVGQFYHRDVSAFDDKFGGAW